MGDGRCLGKVGRVVIEEREDQRRRYGGRAAKHVRQGCPSTGFEVSSEAKRGVGAAAPLLLKAKGVHGRAADERDGFVEEPTIEARVPVGRQPALCTEVVQERDLRPGVLYGCIIVGL